MPENEIQRRYRLEAERKRAEQGQAPEFSMEELAARAMAKLSAKDGQPDQARDSKPVKSSTLGVYGDDDENLIKNETKAVLENAGAMAASVGRALLDKAKVAAAVAQEKARQAQERASAAATQMAGAKEERERQRMDKAAEAAVAPVRVSEPLTVEPVKEVQKPQQPKAVESIGEQLPKTWVVKEEKRQRPWGVWIASGIIVVVLAGAGLWLLRSRSSEPVPEPTPMVEATSPAPPVVGPEPMPVEAIVVEPAHVAVQPEIAEPDPSITEIPAPPKEKAVEPVMPPVAVKPVVRSVQPKPAATVPMIKPAPKPSASKPEPKKDWQDQGMQDLDALEKKLGG